MHILHRYIHASCAHVVFVSETKCNTTIATSRISRLPLPNFEIVPSHGKGGGLWLLWSTDVKLIILELSFYFIFARVENVTGSWILGFVYGDPHHVVTDYIYDRILFYSSSPFPLCLVGDFNSILMPHDKLGGSTSNPRHMNKFRTLAQRAALIDLGYRGPAYTWCNNQYKGNLIMQRLDRVLATAPWTALHPAAAVYHLPRFNSDHHPILLRTSPPPPRIQKKFKTENWWLLHPQFEEVCKQAISRASQSWSSASCSLTKHVRSWIKKIPRPDKHLSHIEETMLTKQSMPPTDKSREEEKELQDKYNSTLHQINAYWLQRSRLRWNAEGDLNTAFFHATTSARRRRNMIHMLQREDGTWTVCPKEIKASFVKHFRSIYCEPDLSPPEWPPEVTAGVQANLPVLDQLHRAHLEERPTAQEIMKAVFGLGPDRAPGSDGINARLIQTYWPVFRPIIEAEVNSFFAQPCFQQNLQVRT